MLDRLRVYAGVGSRTTPAHVLDVMKQLGFALARAGGVLRSGAAEGADSAFEQGARDAGGVCRIYLPWRGFNHRPNDAITYLVPSDQDFERAFQIARSVHPAWDRLTRPQRLLHARNVFQVLGLSCDRPCDAVICFTPGGRQVGGTATALKIADRWSVPVHNLGSPDVYAQWTQYFGDRPS